MYRPRDITDSIATAALIIIIVATIAIVLINILGIQMPDIVTSEGSVNSSVLDPLIHTSFGFDFEKMDPASKIIFGALAGLMMFLVITVSWAYFYRYRGRHK